MARSIQKVAVIGAGVMGAGIAAHLANAGIPVYLLDILPPEREEGVKEDSPAWRNALALRGIDNALKAKPTPLFYSKRDAKLVTPGNTTDNRDWLGEVDWIVEVVPEVMAIKKATFEMIEQHRQPGTIVTSNTSGLSVAQMLEGRSDDFRQHFLVTHFFNPVRHMKLLELVVGPDTLPEVVQLMAEFGETMLGKGIVFGKDTPNFVANRIGVYGMLAAIHRMIEHNLTPEAVDKIMGPATGRPKSAAFRTADLVGIDTLVHVAKTVYDSCPQDEARDSFQVPAFMQQMVEKKLHGDKTKGGFYKMVKEGGKKTILRLDFNSFEYVPQEKVDYPSLKLAKGIEDVGERIKAITNADDPAARYAWDVIRDTLVYSANRLGEIADDIVNIDRGMRWGFNWALGPFETWDALGVQETADRIRQDGLQVPAVVEKLLASGKTSFYQRNTYWDQQSGDYKPIPVSDKVISLKELKAAGKQVATNDSASLIDLGDGVYCLEFHSKMNVIDDSTISMTNQAVEHVKAHGKGLVVSNQAENFSAGANLFMIMMGVMSGDMAAIDGIVSGFQNALMGLKYAPFPVVVAPFGLTLGGGCEYVLHGDRVVGHGELYLGLVEVGAGLVPGGGGCKEALVRGFENQRAFYGKLDKAGVLANWDPDRTKLGGPMSVVQKAFENIGMAKVSSSFREAQENGLLRKTDRLVMNRDHLIYEAKQEVLKMAPGYQAPEPMTFRLPGPGGRAAVVHNIGEMALKGGITPHDRVVGSWLGRVLTGGDHSYATLLNEQDVLDLEREAFMALLQEQATVERMQHLLETGKPLRN